MFAFRFFFRGIDGMAGSLMHAGSVEVGVATVFGTLGETYGATEVGIECGGQYDDAATLRYPSMFVPIHRTAFEV